MQMTIWPCDLVEVSLDFVLIPADSRGLVPMQLGPSNCAIAQPYPSDTFPFPPACQSVGAPQSLDLSDANADGKSRDPGNSLEYLEVHNRAYLCRGRADVGTIALLQASSSRELKKPLGQATETEVSWDEADLPDYSDRSVWRDGSSRLRITFFGNSIREDLLQAGPLAPGRSIVMGRGGRGSGGGKQCG